MNLVPFSPEIQEVEYTEYREESGYFDILADYASQIITNTSIWFSRHKSIKLFLWRCSFVASVRYHFANWSIQGNLWQERNLAKRKEQLEYELNKEIQMDFQSLLLPETTKQLHADLEEARRNLYKEMKKGGKI